MLSQHVSQELTAYCHGELAEEAARRVAEHVVACARCRRELEEIKAIIKLGEQLPRAVAPDALWNEIEAAYSAQSRRAAPKQQPSQRRFILSWQAIAVACSVLLFAFGAAWLIARRTGNVPQRAGNNQPAIKRGPEEKAPPPMTSRAWDVSRLAGAPLVGAERIGENGRLIVGEWLETDASSRARINVADIGQVEVGPNSRVRLVETSASEHRLAMTRGRISAVINAPPRLFIVDTPSAVAVDLGCAYTLDVDDAGRSVLHVTSGWVALETSGRESIVPAGAICVTEPGKGPGTPYFDDVSEKFRDALLKLDFQQGGARELKIILSEAREYDTLTLWHLLSRVPQPERARIYERMAALVAPPKEVTREGILRLDKKMLDLWREELEWAWFE